MQEITLAVETITPLFLGGAYPRGGLTQSASSPPGAVELRTPSLRGALRYWLRAALGGIVGGDLCCLRDLESQVFGSTLGTGALNLRITSSLSPNDCEEYKVLGTRSNPLGRDYLYWSMAKSGSQERGNYQPARHYIRPLKAIEVVIRSPVEAEDWRWFAGRAAFWLLLQLGGLGSRSRRAAGSLAAKPFVFGDGLNLNEERSPSALRDTLSRGIRTVRDRLQRQFTGGSVPSRPAFDILHPQHCSIWVLADGNRPWTTAMAAVDALGTKMREFRSGKPSNRRQTNLGSAARRVDLFERAVFGLPLPFVGSGGPINGERHDRRASPLWLKIARLSENQYVGVATLFRSVFLPDQEGLKAGDRRASSPPSYELIEEFIQQFPGKWEVELS